MISKTGSIFLFFPAIAAILAAVFLVKPETLQTITTSPEPVLVIDAGHGGADGGAVAADGTEEADINLDIALKLEALCKFIGCDCIMTREKKEIDYPDDARTLAQMKLFDQKSRINTVNETNGAVLLSIHQNFYSLPSPFGAQIFYGIQEGSADFASILQSNLNEFICVGNRRIEAQIDSDIYLMKSVHCTAVLAECGFISNPGELSLLKTDDYRLRLAALFCGSWLQFSRGMIV